MPVVGFLCLSTKKCLSVGVALCGGLTRVSCCGARMARERLGCAEQEERDVANLIGKGRGCVASMHLRVQLANVYNCILAGMLVCSRLGALVRRR